MKQSLELLTTRGESTLKRLRPLLAPYVVATFAVGSALILTLMLQSLLTPSLFQLFFAAVTVSTWYGGMEAGLLATALSSLAITYFLIEPKHSLLFFSLDSILRLVVFVLVAILISSLNAGLSTAKRHLEISLQHLRSSEARFGCLAKSNIIGVIVADINGGIVEANDAFLRMVGYTREELLSGEMQWRDLTPPEYFEVTQRSIQELRERGACAPFEKEYLCKDGRRVPVLKVSALLESNRERIIGFVVDLSERKQAEQALQKSEQRFKLLVESNIFGLAFGDSSGVIHYANDYFLNMVGYTLEELHSGKVRWDEMTPPEYRQIDAQALAESKHRKIATPFEKEYIRKDGSRVPILIGGAVLDNSDSERLEMIAFALDLSKQQAALRERKQAEEALRLITDAVPALISYVDAQQRYRFNNKGYEEWHGISASDIRGKHIKEVVGESVYESIRPYVEAVLSGEYVTYETKLSYKDGTIRYVNVSYVPQFSSNAEVVGFVALIKDITQRKQAELALKQSEERFRQLAEKAEAANRMKDEFLATLSHELRTPLNAILGWTQLLTTRKFNESTTSRALETIDRNSKLLATLIEDVLDVSRIITGKLRLEVRPIQLAPVVLSAIETVRSAADAKGITIETFLDSSIGVVLGDINRLQQIVWNLLSNAVKFTPRSGRVYVRLSTSTEFTDGHSALLQVTDTGEGIAPEFLPYVFERFRQADSSSTRSHGGLGLGLAIVRHLVELHGGTVRAESAGIGQGATFIVSLPIKVTTVELIEPQQMPSTLEVQVAQNSNLKLDGLRVLVVDDEPDARQIITTVLGQYEAKVMAVATVTEALTALQQFQPDVLVSDIGMPQEDGYSLIRKVRALDEAKGGRTPAVALTAYARAEDRALALLAGFQLHVPKPVNPAELAAVVANLAGRT